MQFSPWKMRRPKKRSTPRRRARKKEDDSSLRFFILETLSQRFLQNILIDFRFFEKIEKCKKKLNFWKCFAKISVTKFRERKIWDCYHQKDNLQQIYLVAGENLPYVKKLCHTANQYFCFRSLYSVDCGWDCISSLRFQSPSPPKDEGPIEVFGPCDPRFVPSFQFTHAAC